MLETPDPTIITILFDSCRFCLFVLFILWLAKKVSDLSSFALLGWLGTHEEHEHKDRGENWFVTLSFKQLACLFACFVTKSSMTGAHGIYGWFEMWEERCILVWNRRVVSSDEDGDSSASLRH